MTKLTRRTMLTGAAAVAFAPLAAPRAALAAAPLAGTQAPGWYRYKVGNFEILVPASEHNFWMDDGEMSRAPKGRMEGLFKNNRRVFAGEVMKRLRTYEAGKEVVPGITSVATNGHSAGHNSHIVSSGSSAV